VRKDFFAKGSGPLRAAFFSGAALLLAIAGAVGFLFATGGAGIFGGAGEQVSFHRLLQEYDFRLEQALGGPAAPGYQQFGLLSRDLDRLEARAQGVENWLSVLRRRRRLADGAAEFAGAAHGARYAQAYRQAAQRALREFPFSEPIAAVAAAASIRGAAITPEMEGELRAILPRMSSQRFAPMRLSLHALLGDFRSPESAAASLQGDRLPLDFAAGAMGRDAEPIVAALAMLRILDGEPAEALSIVQSALARGGASPEFARFAAEVFYDFGSPARSAELFHMLSGEDAFREEALSRQADALWAAGYTGLARHVWGMLAAPSAPLAPRAAAALPSAPRAAWEDIAAIESRALHNLAATAEDPEEAEALLERLMRQGRSGDACRELGLVRLSRLMDAPGAVGLLQADLGLRGFAMAGGDMGQVELRERLVRQGQPGYAQREQGLARLGSLAGAPGPLALMQAQREALGPGGAGRGFGGEAGGVPLSAAAELEILKRRVEMGEAGRMVADVWMLLRRYPEAEGLHEWAAWFFALQRSFEETDLLLSAAERQGFSGRWKAEHRALSLIREGRFDEAESALEALELEAEGSGWAAAANLGRLAEARNASARALEHYQRALALLAEARPGGSSGGGSEIASQLQVRIARCLRTIGRPDESRRALLLALELNPNNLAARLELGR